MNNADESINAVKEGIKGGDILICPVCSAMVLALVARKHEEWHARVILRPESMVKPIITQGPHSRACGTAPHGHGRACHKNCPTCEGKDIS